jgi:hypothetical protein
MERLMVTLTVLILLGGSAIAGTFRVHYSIQGAGKDITVQADSPSEARQTVMDIIPGAVVTGVRKIK